MIQDRNQKAFIELKSCGELDKNKQASIHEKSYLSSKGRRAWFSPDQSVKVRTYVVLLFTLN